MKLLHLIVLLNSVELICCSCAFTFYIRNDYPSPCGNCQSGSDSFCCKTLMDALKQQTFQVESCAYTYNLPLGIQTINDTVPLFSNTRQYYLHFNGQESTIICTEESTGWSFTDIESVTLRSVTFVNCSSLRSSTTKNPTASGTLEFEVSLYFVNCETVQLFSVNVTTTAHVTGVLMYNPGGIQATYSHFAGGQSGLVLELTHCKPGDISCTSHYNTRTSATYSFENCSFSKNTALSVISPDDVIFPNGSVYNTFNKGGGLSIVVKGVASSNTFRIVNCTFVDNQAQYGGGLFVSFLDRAYDNSIVVQRSLFRGNSCPLKGEIKTSGGGVHIEDLAFHDETFSNGLSFWELNSFVENTAFTGGGVYVTLVNRHFTLREGCTDCGIWGSVFAGNTAVFGSALYVHRPVSFRRYFVLSNCTFQNNSIKYSKEKGTISQTGLATVYSKENIHFEGVINFTSNEGSALVMVSAIANFSANSKAHFVNNTGTRGGAISLLGDAYMLIGRKSELTFRDNIATFEGGAIYNSYLEPHSGTGYDNCFIKYEDASLDPDLWETNVIFSGNRVLNGPRVNSIHSTSILPCMIQGSQNGTPLCWKNWTYNDDKTCTITDHVTTDYNVQNSYIRNNSISAQPGWQYKIPLVLEDDFGQNIMNNIDAYVTASDSTVLSISTEEGLSVNKEIGNTLEVVYESLNDHSMHFELDIDIQVCPPGFVYDNISGCVCPAKMDGLYCNEKVAALNENFWIGLLNESDSDYYLAPCPAQFCSTKDFSFHVLPKESSSLSAELCQGNRVGVLCGECRIGHCLAVNSWTLECVASDNTDSTSRILQYTAAVYLPFACILVFLSVFHIKLTMGSLNAFVLFAQMITTSFELTEHGNIPLQHPLSLFPNTYRFLYGPFNLDFVEKYIRGLCFSTHFNALSLLRLNYLLLIVPTACVIVISTCYCIYKRVKRYHVPQTNETEYQVTDYQDSECYQRFRILSKSHAETVILLLSTLALLSYTKLSNTSAQILYLKKLRNIGNGTKVERVFMAGQFSSDDTGYYSYKVPAILAEIYLILFIVVLLDYPLKLVEFLVQKIRFCRRFKVNYPLRAVNLFARAFQDSFRPPFRFFAGVYFIFRYTVSLVHLMSFSSIQKYVVQEVTCISMLLLLVICKPYRENIHNITDVCIFTNLAVINALNCFQHDYHLFSGRNHASSHTFFLQYVLAIIPVVVLSMCVFWKCSKQYRKKLTSKLLSRPKLLQLNDFLQSVSQADMVAKLTESQTNSPPETAGIETEECSKLLRGKKKGGASNSKLNPSTEGVPVTIVDVVDKGMGEAATSQSSTSEGYYLRKEWNSVGCGLYGAIDHK